MVKPEDSISNNASIRTQDGTQDSAQADEWRTWYNDFDKNYGPEERKRWYSQAAKSYRWARPCYPDALIDDVIQQAGLKAGESVLEMGCGPGIATESFARRGFAMQCVEPSPAACELARQTCADYADVVVTNSTFEDFPLAGRQFDAVLAATSFHWVSPAIACKKSAAALKPGGSLILLWATPPRPSEVLSSYLQPIYEKYQLADKIRYQLRHQAYYQENFEKFARVLDDSGYFAYTAVDIAKHHSTYSIEKYIALLSTLSDYIALPSETRQQLLTELAARLADRCGDEPLPLTHWFAAQAAPLIADA